MRLCFCLIAAVAAANAMEPVAPAPPSAAWVVRADPHTGRLVRSVVVTQKAVSGRTLHREAAGIDKMVKETAGKYKVDPLLVHSVIQVESNYNPYAVSPKGAEGLMQLVPSTARRFGVKNSFDAQENIEAGVKYLKHLQDLFGDDRKALAAYNAGEGAVARYDAIPPYPETVTYVDKVGKKYGEARRAAEAKRAAASASEKPARDEHPKLEEYIDWQGRIFLRTR
ncbi:MAG: lytic transglycosylase domain-containing protein [Bryobacteraceae bacterium]